MNRTLQVAGYGLFLILIFLGITAGIQSCGNKKDEQSLEEKAEEVADSYTSDEFFEDEDGETTSDEDSDDFESSDDRIDALASRSNATSELSTSSATTSYTSSSRGDYLVVAGNYLLEDNANKMVRKLKNLGYSGAEKVVFDLSQYHTVLAGRYSSRTEASRQGSSLKSKGVDNYIVSKK